MRKGKVVAYYEQDGYGFNYYYDIYEFEISGIKFYGEKNYKYEEIDLVTNEISYMNEKPYNQCNIYSNQNYLEYLLSHLCADSTNGKEKIEWIEPLTEIVS